MTTRCEDPILNEPIKFLGATVLSFNITLGLGSQPSTLNVDLVEDCDVGDEFEPNKFDGDPNKKAVGDPVYFSAGDINFGGIISSWNVRKGTSGRTFNVKVEDPRQLLQNAIIVVDSYNGPPKVGANYINVYHHLEESLCSQFGFSFHTDQGTPYLNILQALQDIDPMICAPFYLTPAGGSIKIDWTTFPGGINSPFQSFPQFFRLQGPAIPLQEILSQACELAGFEYYINMINNGGIPTIVIGLIDLRNPPSSFGNLIDSFQGFATELSYGQELRNETTKTMMIGEYLHYLSEVDTFLPYFGEDIINGEKVHVTPYGWDNNGFWIIHTIGDLNLTLENPFPVAGPFQISELDIRYAMSGFKAWTYWIFMNQAKGTFNDAIRAQFPLVNQGNFQELIAAMGGNLGAINNFGHWLDNLSKSPNARAVGDVANAPTRGRRESNKPQIIEDLENVHKWIQNLGSTYYGKQFLCPLNEGICYYLTDYTVNNGELVFSSNPTTGGWVDPGIPVLGLEDPYLEVFREQDGKLGGFSVFNTDGILADDIPNEIDNNGNFGVPQPGGVGGGGGLAGFCWVAREIYGTNSNEWLIFRDWILNRAPILLKNIYGKYGERFSLWIKNKPYIKFMIKQLMDIVVKRSTL